MPLETLIASREDPWARSLYSASRRKNHRWKFAFVRRTSVYTSPTCIFTSTFTLTGRWITSALLLCPQNYFATPTANGSILKLEKPKQNILCCTFFSRILDFSRFNYQKFPINWVAYQKKKIKNKKIIVKFEKKVQYQRFFFFNHLIYWRNFFENKIWKTK